MIKRLQAEWFEFCVYYLSFGQGALRQIFLDFLMERGTDPDELYVWLEGRGQ
jgi:hypothetical protein